MPKTALDRARLIWISQEALPPHVYSALCDAWDLTMADKDRPLDEQLAGAAVATLWRGGGAGCTCRRW